MSDTKSRLPSLQVRLFLGFALVTVLAAVLPAFFSRATLYDDRIELARDQALVHGALLKGVLAAGPESALTAAQLRSIFQAAEAQSIRLTVLDANDRVLLDSHIREAQLEGLDNHGDRPEIEQARQNGRGSSLRHSNSLGTDLVYAALLLDGGGVLRVAVPLSDIEHSLQTELSSLSLVIAGVALFCLILSTLFAGRVRKGITDMAGVVESISRGPLKKRLYHVPWREFLPLAGAVNKMAVDMENYMSTTLDQQLQLETVLNSLHEGVLVLDRQGRIRRCNPALEKLFPGIKSVMGGQLIEALPLPGLQRAVDRLLKGRDRYGDDAGADASGGIHFEYPHGRFLVAHLSGPVEDNPSLGAVAVFYNATELMKLERVRRDFVSNVSHELRTPLTAIAGSAEILAGSGELPEDLRPFAGVIQRHAAMLSNLVSGLLSLARLENNGEAIAMAEVNPADALDNAVALNESQIAQKRLHLRLDLPDKLRVTGNNDLLTQVFRNLLENAIRYSPDGGEILVRAEPVGLNITCMVADQGPGLPENERERVFERFYQVEKGRGSGGAGLGLAICKHIVERHGGSIRAESSYEGWATAIIFTLPAAF